MAVKLSEAETKLPNRMSQCTASRRQAVRTRPYGKYATEKLIHEIVSLGKITVVEGSRTDDALKDQLLAFTGTIDANMAARLGTILSVDAVIIGTVHAQGKDVELIARMVQSGKAVILSSVSERCHAGTFMHDTDEIPETPAKTVIA
jgi:polyhydroxyalkanoate synthesis regulator phasin